MDRRYFILATLGSVAFARMAQATPARIEVYKSPTCGCCSAWAAHMAEAGFTVDAQNVDQDSLDALKARSGITHALASCHTALVDGYVIEGHVPARDVERLLAERPDAVGLSVPGMPIGSPGMEMGNRRDVFDTLLVLHDRTTVVFQHHA